jgi:hypothetical protein
MNMPPTAASSFADPLTAQIAEFLTGIGIAVVAAELPDDTFLPGVLIQAGTLHVDERRLRHPGDLLHEAGHLAALPPAQRRLFGDDPAPEGTDMRRLEVVAIAWSYAAALALQIDPAVVFHDEGYGGRGPGLLQNFSLGVYFGVSELEQAGLAARRGDGEQQPYPHLVKWTVD